MNQSELEAKKLEKRIIFITVINTILTMSIILLLPNPSEPSEKLRVLGAIVLLLIQFSLSNALGLAAIVLRKKQNKSD